MVDLMSPVSLAERPSYDAACKLVPPEYLIAWDWFLREEQRAAHWRNLPHRTRKDDPQFPYRPQEFPITRDSGIFSIGLEHLSNKPKIDFALSVHNSKRSAYIDVPPLYLNDGTWLLKYSTHVRGEGTGHFQLYNEKLFNCMRYGVPVGVLFTEGISYRVMGLAFVERYEPENGWFILHGPVHKGGPDKRFSPAMHPCFGLTGRVIRGSFQQAGRVGSRKVVGAVWFRTARLPPAGWQYVLHRRMVAPSAATW